jgi:cell wall-associated NlpC family hydrolase
MVPGTFSVIPEWAARYVGVPFLDNGRSLAGCDCFGLVHLVLREQFGVELPSYVGAYASAQEMDEVSSLIAGRIPADGWRRVLDHQARPGDGIVLRVMNRPWHVGVMVTATEFLHVSEVQSTSTIERVDGPRWKRRVVGFYRHEALA